MSPIRTGFRFPEGNPHALYLAGTVGRRAAQQKIIHALFGRQLRPASDRSEGSSVPSIDELRHQLAALDAQLDRESTHTLYDPAMAAQVRARQQQNKELFQQAEELEQQFIEKKKLAETIRKQKEQMALLTCRAQQERDNMMSRLFALRLQMTDAEKKRAIQRKLYAALLGYAQQLAFLDTSDLTKRLDDPAHWESAKDDILSQLDAAHQFGIGLAPQSAPGSPAADTANAPSAPQAAPDTFTLLQDSLQNLLRCKGQTDKLSFDELLSNLKLIHENSQNYLETAIGNADSEDAFTSLSSPVRQAQLVYAGALLSFTADLIPKLENVASLCAQSKTAVRADSHVEYAVNYVNTLKDAVAEQTGAKPTQAPAVPVKSNIPQRKI